MVGCGALSHSVFVGAGTIVEEIVVLAKRDQPYFFMSNGQQRDRKSAAEPRTSPTHTLLWPATAISTASKKAM